VRDFSRGSETVLEKHDDHWREFPAGSFDTVRMQVVAEETTVRSLIRSGDLDFTSHFQTQETYDVLAEEDDIYVTEDPTTTGFNLKINTSREPTSDTNVRKALAWGFDYETAVEQAGGVAKRNPLPPSFSEARTDDITSPSYDPERAREFLQQSDYSPGEITLQYVFVSGSTIREEMGLLLQQNMSEIGINIELNGWAWGRLSDTAGSEDPAELPHIVAMFFAPLYPSPYAFFYQRYHSEADNTWANMERLNDDEVDDLIDTGARTVDPDERNEVWKELQQLVTSLYPAIFIQADVYRHAVNNRVDGYEFIPANGFQYAFHRFFDTNDA
jgi:peptide/nickel transport system substrate-binding protein